jgi:tetratricopeptide (TPR) repeat protein
VELEKLSLVNKRHERFTLLPLTKMLASSELGNHTAFQDNASRRWIDYLKKLCKVVDDEYYWRHRSYVFHNEGPSILEAIEWSYQYGTADDIFILTRAAIDYLDALGDINGLLMLCRRALDLARAVDDPVTIARLAVIEGWVFRQWGAYQEAEAAFRDALKKYHQVSNREGECAALLNLSGVYRKTKRFDKAKELLDQAWSISESLSIGDLKALIGNEYGRLARDMKDWELACSHFSSVRDLFEERIAQRPQDESLVRVTWGQLAIVAYHLGRPQEAKELCLKSLEFFETQGSKEILATLKHRLALIEEALGENEAALEHVTEAKDWFDRLGMKPDLAEAEALLQRLQ